MTQPPDPTSGSQNFPPPQSGPPYGAPPPPPAGGYPPPGQQPPPPGYGAAPGGAPGFVGPGYVGPGYAGPGNAAPPPPGYNSSEEKTWALVSHFGVAVAGFVSGGVLAWVPALVAFLSKGKESPTVRAHSQAALNFSIIWSAVALAGIILGSCGSIIVVGAVLFLLEAAAVVLQVVFGIIAGLRANDGQLYKYPLSYQLVK